MFRTNNNTPIVGTISFAGGATLTYTDPAVFLEAIKDELPYRRHSGFTFQILSKSALVHKFVDDLVYSDRGEENPRDLDYYFKDYPKGKEEDPQRGIEKMDMTVRPMKPEEREYAFTHNEKNNWDAGCIGYLRGDMGPDGNDFYTSWNRHGQAFDDTSFKPELNTVVDMLRFDERFGELLNNRSSLTAYCYGHPDSAYHRNYVREFGFRADTQQYSYLIRCNPNKGDYNFYMYCYRRQQFDRYLHLRLSRQLSERLKGAQRKSTDACKGNDQRKHDTLQR